MRDKVRCAVAICASVLAAGAGGRSPHLASTAAPGKGFTIAVATDVHYLAPELRDNGKAFRAFEASGDGRQLGDVDEIVAAFARDVRRLAPDALVISGDLTNNGEKRSHLALAARLAEIESTSGTRVFVVPGNHDIMNPWARRFDGGSQVRVDSIARDEFRTIYARFGYDEAISSDPSSLSYLAAPSDAVWLLMLDTSVSRFNRLLGRPNGQGALAAGTLEWIRQCAGRAKERRARVITVMHHNLVEHSELLHGGYTLDNGDEVRRLFQALGLDIVLSGHLHVQDIRRVDAGPTPVFDIATSALSVYPQQYGVLVQLPSGAVDYRTSRVDVEAWAREEGGKRKQLREFRAYSEARFRRASYEKTYAALRATGLYSTRDRKLMAETMSRLNASYFAGTASEVSDEVLASEGYRLWTTATEPAFLKRYVLSMIPRTAANHTRVRVPPPAGATE